MPRAGVTEIDDGADGSALDARDHYRWLTLSLPEDLLLAGLGVDAACAAGFPEKAVQDWLESIRRTGMDARFTKSWRPSATEKAKVLESDLCKFLYLSHSNPRN